MCSYQPRVFSPEDFSEFAKMARVVYGQQELFVNTNSTYTRLATNTVWVALVLPLVMIEV
jgi:hypothetical protein